MPYANYDISIFEYVSSYTSKRIKKELASLKNDLKKDAIEIRIRLGRPLEIVLKKGSILVNVNGEKGALKSDIDETLEFISQSSVYAVQNELISGYITLKGGHRAGICAKGVLKDGQLVAMRDVSSINIRIAREIKGASDSVIDKIAGPGGVKNTLIISPPGCGKTTLLRDISRKLSTPGEIVGFSPKRVSIIDERSEIAASYEGAPQKDVGIKCDVLDSVQKPVAVEFLIRSMNPEIIITDELSRKEDIDAMLSAAGCGVTIMASAHGKNLRQIRKKTLFAPLFEKEIFELFITLEKESSVGHIAAVEEL